VGEGPGGWKRIRRFLFENRETDQGSKKLTSRNREKKTRGAGRFERKDKGGQDLLERPGTKQENQYRRRGDTAPTVTAMKEKEHKNLSSKVFTCVRKRALGKVASVGKLIFSRSFQN